jgi:hypothetical protein
MSSGPEGEKIPSRQGRISDGICSDSCVIQDPLTWQAGPYMTMPSDELCHRRRCQATPAARPNRLTLVSSRGLRERTADAVNSV